MTGAIEQSVLWTVIVGLALGCYALRFFFIGLVGDREVPAWLMRHLRYTAVAAVPALIAPLILWPPATGGTPDLPRLGAAAVTLAIAIWSKNVIAAVTVGAVSLYVLLYLL